MNKKLGSLLSKTSQLMLYSKALPENRFAKIVMEVKSKMKDCASSPKDFPDKVEQFLDFKTNYIKLAYPKAFLSDSDKEIIEISVRKFLETTDMQKLDSTPEYMIASTANFLNETEKLVKERFIDRDSAPLYMMAEAQAKREADNEYERNKPKEERAEKEPIDVDEERKLIDEKGFYNLRRDKKEAEKIEHGKFYIENGKMYYGAAEKREPVSYSNWYAGNLDPEQLNKHKELLDRQHFSGPFWQNRQMPRSVLDETFKQYLTGIEHEAPEVHPKDLPGAKQKTENFTQVKR